MPKALRANWNRSAGEAASPQVVGPLAPKAPRRWKTRDRGWAKAVGRRKVPVAVQREELAHLAAIHFEFTGCCRSLREATKHLRERGFPRRFEVETPFAGSRAHLRDAPEEVGRKPAEECIKCGASEFALVGERMQRRCIPCKKRYELEFQAKYRAQKKKGLG